MLTIRIWFYKDIDTLRINETPKSCDRCKWNQGENGDYYLLDTILLSSEYSWRFILPKKKTSNTLVF